MSTESMGSLDIVHGISGKSGQSPETDGNCPLSPWTMSTESIDNDSVDIVLSSCSNTPAGQCPWKMSTETMDFLQTGNLHDK